MRSEYATSANFTAMADLKLHAYQERAIEFCMDNPSTYLAVDMGLGKTAICLKLIERLKQPAMVLGPLFEPQAQLVVVL